MTDTGLSVSVTGAVALFALDRPARRNGVNAQLIATLLAALEQYDADDNVRAIVIAGNGDYFCVGADLDQGAEVFDATKPGRWGGQRDLGGVLTLRLLACRKPVIAAAHGIAAGMGATLMLACDLRIAAQGTRFSFPFLGRGLCTDACAGTLLPRAVGPQTAAFWLYTARAISAEEALNKGLILEITPPDALRTRAMAIAQEIAERTSPVAVAYTKQLLARGFGTSRIDEVHRWESRFIRYMSKRADLVEGIRSFKEKRPPQFPMKVSTDMPDFFPWWEDSDFSDLQTSPDPGPAPGTPR